MELARLIKSWLLIALGVLVASNTAQGIHYDDTGALVFAVLLLSLCNVFLKPLLMLFSLPFIILTFGIGIWLINALLFLFVGYLVEGFYVDSFGHALWGAFLVSLTGWLASVLFSSQAGRKRNGMNVRVFRSGGRPGGPAASPAPKVKKDDDDVIDV